MPVDATAPTTVSDAVATYVSTAAIKLTATDAGSGVAATYYRLDGGAQTAGTSIAVTALGSHTLQFWSVDVAGNIEAAKTVNFTVTAPEPPMGTVATSTVTISADSRSTRLGRSVHLTGELSPSLGGDAIQLWVLAPKSKTWVLANELVTQVQAPAATSFTALWADRLSRYDDEHDDDRYDDAVLAAPAPALVSTWASDYTLTRRGTYRFQARFAGDVDSGSAVSAIASVRVR